MESMRRSEANSSHHPNKVAVNSLATESNKQSSGSGSVLNNNKLNYNQEQNQLNQKNINTDSNTATITTSTANSVNSSSAIPSVSQSSTTSSSVSSGGSSSSSESKDTNFEYEDEWDVGGIRELIIDLDADIEKSSGGGPTSATTTNENSTVVSGGGDSQTPDISNLENRSNTNISDKTNCGPNNINKNINKIKNNNNNNNNNNNSGSGELIPTNLQPSQHCILNAIAKSPSDSSSSSSSSSSNSLSSSPTTVSSTKSSSLSSLFKPIPTALGRESSKLQQQLSNQATTSTVSSIATVQSGRPQPSSPSTKQSSKQINKSSSGGVQNLKLQQPSLVAQLNSKNTGENQRPTLSSSTFAGFSKGGNLVSQQQSDIVKPAQSSFNSVDRHTNKLPSIATTTAINQTGGNSSMSSQPSGGQGAGKSATKMSIDHQATLDKGLKMKIKRTKPGTKTSEAKHEIVKAEQNGNSTVIDDAQPNNNTSSSSSSSSGKKHGNSGSSNNQINQSSSTGGQTNQAQGTKRGSSSHRRDKTKDKTPHSREKSDHGNSGSNSSNNSLSSSHSNSSSSANDRSSNSSSSSSSSSTSSSSCNCTHEMNGIQSATCTNLTCIRNRTTTGNNSVSGGGSLDSIAQRISGNSGNSNTSSQHANTNSMSSNSSSSAMTGGNSSNLGVGSTNNHASAVFSTNNNNNNNNNSNSGSTPTSCNSTPNAPGPPSGTINKDVKPQPNVSNSHQQSSSSQINNSTSSSSFSNSQQLLGLNNNSTNSTLNTNLAVTGGNQTNPNAKINSSGTISATVHHTISVPSNSSLANNSNSNNNDDGTKSPPAKRAKCDPKDMVDICVGTSVGTITEPDCLGPCEPGTSVTLEGIVWHETESGVLVVNVTWRGKTYVGTLLDCTKHDWAPPRFCDSPTEELDSRTPKGRGKRGRSAALTPDLSNFTETRSSVHSKLRNGGAKGRGGRTTTGSSTSTTTTTTTATASSSSSASSSSATTSTTNSSNTPSTSPTAFLPPRPEKRKSKDECPSPLNGESFSVNASGLPISASTGLTTQSLVNPITGLNVQISTKKCKTASPCAISPVLLECPEQDCSKKYKHANGLRYHQSHAHGSGSMDEDSQQLPESPIQSIPPTTPSPAPMPIPTTPQPQITTSVPSSVAILSSASLSPTNSPIVTTTASVSIPLAITNSTTSASITVPTILAPVLTVPTVATIGAPVSSSSSSLSANTAPPTVSVTSGPPPVVSASAVTSSLLTTSPPSNVIGIQVAPIALQMQSGVIPVTPQPQQIPSQHAIPGGSITAGISGQALSQHQQHSMLVGTAPSLLPVAGQVMADAASILSAQQSHHQQLNPHGSLLGTGGPSRPGDVPIKPGVLRFGPQPPDAISVGPQGPNPLRSSTTLGIGSNTAPPLTPESAHQPVYPGTPQSGGPQGIPMNKTPNYGKQKKNRKSPLPSDFENSMSRDGVQSPAYSDISDDSSPIVDNEMNGKSGTQANGAPASFMKICDVISSPDKSQSAKHTDIKKPQDGVLPPQMPQLGGYGMYQFYPQQQYMVPPEHQAVKQQQQQLPQPPPPSSQQQTSMQSASSTEYNKNKEPPLDLMTKPSQPQDQNNKDIGVPNPSSIGSSISGVPGVPNQPPPPTKPLPHFYPFNYMPPGYPYNVDPNYGPVSMVSDENKLGPSMQNPPPTVKDERIKESPSPHEHVKLSGQMIPTKLIKTEPQGKDITIKQEPNSHSMHSKEPPVPSMAAYSNLYQRHPLSVPPPPQHLSRDEELRRYYIYEQRRSNQSINQSGPGLQPQNSQNKDDSSMSQQSSMHHPSSGVSVSQSQQIQSSGQSQQQQNSGSQQQKSSKSNSSSQQSSGQKATNLIKEPKEEKDVKIKQEGQKPTMETQGPPPPPTSQYFLHPSYISSGPFGFDPTHPMYRNVLMSTAPYNTPPYHIPMARFHAPEDLSRNPNTKALDALHHAASQYYNTHKIHELSERALKSPTSSNVKVSVSSPNVSQQNVGQSPGGGGNPNVSGGGVGGPGGPGSQGLSGIGMPPSNPSGGPLNLQPPSGSLPPGLTGGGGGGGGGVSMVGPKSDLKPGNDPLGKNVGPGGIPGNGGNGTDSRSPPPQRHVHTHHHTHVGLTYPMYPAPYGAAVLASQQAAAVAVINPFPPGPNK